MKIIHFPEGLNISPSFSKSMRFKFKLVFIFYFLFFTSCTKEIDLLLDENKTSLVINSIFNPDEYFNFNFSYDTEIT